MSEKYQCHMTINNRLSQGLKPQPGELLWGVFAAGPSPVPMKDAVPAFTAHGKAWAPGGCEGTVVYQVGDDVGQTVSIYFDVPMSPGSKNTVTATATAGLTATVAGFSGVGPTEACEITVRHSA